ncbi:hypothetical protein NPX13_g4518 [Xylaria arbuscula]|uniref:Uncharacterized protein n=1 Tax=Xylaria arbuscula TaxID=114810 RepID=A0A9W8NFD3_9PEZI|nr:hypothetical protein NPX13_g4518 [Xylaria arbuscula]
MAVLQATAVNAPVGRPYNADFELHIWDNSKASPSSSEHVSDRSLSPQSGSIEIRPPVVRRANKSHGDSAREWQIRGKANGVPVDVLADSGSNINTVSKDEADRIGAVVESDTTRQIIQLASGERCFSLGDVTVEFTFEGEEKIYVLHCSVVETLEWAMIAGYDFLETTETLTRFRERRIREVAPSNLYHMPLSLMVECGTVSNGDGARMEGLINGSRTTVVPDTGSTINAMSTSHADLQGLEIDTTQRTRVNFVDGSTAMTRGVVEGTWIFLSPDKDNGPLLHLANYRRRKRGPGETTESQNIHDRSDDNEEDPNRDPWDYIWEYEWHVIDGLPVDAVLSLDFIKRHDVFNKHQHSFIRTSSRPTIPEILGICELPRGCEGLVDLAEAFLADLTSPDPFRYDMVVRESARRSEIQRTILSLPDDLQAIQRDTEKHRIIVWDSIKDLKDRGEDWKFRRDQYIASLCPHPTQASSSQSPTRQLDSSNNHGKGKKSWLWRSR